MIDLKDLAKKLGFKAMTSNWEAYCHQPWVASLLKEEEAERVRLGMERHKRDAKIGEFKPMADFDWNWPDEIDRELIEELLTLRFLAGRKGSNLAFVGPNGVGKSMIVQNIAYAALVAGLRTRFVPASQMLSELSAQDGDTALNRCLKKYCGYDLLAIDELGYLDYSNRYADLLFQIINGRYQKRSTIITTNKAFQEWGSIFPNAMCVSALVDRLMHNAELVVIKGKSFREREAVERAQSRAKGCKSPNGNGKNGQHEERKGLATVSKGGK